MRKVRIRISTVYVALLVGLLLVWGRAGQLQILEGAEHAEVARAQRTQLVELPAPRGGIFDRNGVPLALTQETFHLGLAPNEVTEGRDSATVERDLVTISRALGLDRRELRRAVSGSRYAYFHGPFSVAQIRAVSSIPGLHPEGELSRFYPDPDLARALLGRAPFGGNPPSGVERMADSLLRGVPGSAVVLRDQRGRRFESPGRLGAFPVPGADVYLTIDAELQEIVETALADALSEYDAVAGDVVVIDPRTGEILALASADSAGRQRLTAINTPYEPGSTAKLFAAAALLERNLVAPTDTVWGEGGRYEHDGRVIHDVNEVQWATLADVIENSSNIGIVKFSQLLQPGHQFEVLRRFGFGTPSGLEFPAESRGVLRHPDQWSGFSGASMAMGYEFSVTPLQLAVAYSAIANGGIVVRPTLFRRVVGAGGRERWTHSPEPVRRAIEEAVADTLMQMLEGVVYRGSRAALTSYDVAGKTGTTRRVGSDGNYVAGSYHASFASIFPSDDPQIVMVVKLEDPRGTYGGQTAAPVTRSVLERTLAAHTNALDRTSLSRNAEDGGPTGLLESGLPPAVVTLPFTPVPDSVRHSTVPDVVGLTVRDAVLRLHRAGYRVRLDGRGYADSVAPSAGDSLGVGSLVHLRGTIQ